MTWIVDPLVTLSHPELLGSWFAPLESRRAWFALVRAAFGLPVPEGDLATYRDISGREHPPTSPAREVWVAAGRRGGKSSTAAGFAIALAIGRDYSKLVKPGEIPAVALLAQHREGAGRLLSYVRGMLEASPKLKNQIETDKADVVRLKNGVELAVATSNFKSLRGATIVSAILDEVAFWFVEGSSNPDAEVIRAIKPAMLTCPGSILIGISSPYAKRGVLYDRISRYHGKPGDRVQAFRAPTLTMNPTADRDEIEAARAEDPEGARAEYDAEFRDDVSDFIDAALVARAVRPDPLELPPRSGPQYLGFVDPSGGRGDAMTLSIAHREGERVVIDLVRGVRPPFDPAAVVAEFCRVLRDYSISTVTADAYAAEWVVSAFRAHDVRVMTCALNRSKLYLELLPLLTQARVELPDHRALVAELRSLERKTGRGADVVDHPPAGHDDHANAVAGSAWLARERPNVEPRIRMIGPGDEGGIAREVAQSGMWLGMPSATGVFRH